MLERETISRALHCPNALACPGGVLSDVEAENTPMCGQGAQRESLIGPSLNRADGSFPRVVEYQRLCDMLLFCCSSPITLFRLQKVLACF